MKRGWLITLSLLTASVTACGTRVDYMPLNPPPHPPQPRAANSVEVFMSKPPERPYVEVGMIEAQQQSEFSSDRQQRVLGKMREEAGRQGCDGIILLGSNDQTVVSGSSNRNGGSVSSATLRGYRASCIVYQLAPAGPAPLA